jgi:hypothetical protein
MDGQGVPITAGWGAAWEAGEKHTSGTDADLLALAVEGSALDFSKLRILADAPTNTDAPRSHVLVIASSAT